MLLNTNKSSLAQLEHKIIFTILFFVCNVYEYIQYHYKFGVGDNALKEVSCSPRLDLVDQNIVKSVILLIYKNVKYLFLCYVYVINAIEQNWIQYSSPKINDRVKTVNLNKTYLHINIYIFIYMNVINSIVTTFNFKCFLC